MLLKLPCILFAAREGKQHSMSKPSLPSATRSSGMFQFTVEKSDNTLTLLKLTLFQTLQETEEEFEVARETSNFIQRNFMRKLTNYLHSTRCTHLPPKLLLTLTSKILHFEAMAENVNSVRPICIEKLIIFVYRLIFFSKSCMVLLQILTKLEMC